jgi:hypothetical protein
MLLWVVGCGLLFVGTTQYDRYWRLVVGIVVVVQGLLSSSFPLFTSLIEEKSLLNSQRITDPKKNRILNA